MGSKGREKMTTGPGGRDDTTEGVLNQPHTSEARLSGDDPQAGARSASPTEGVLNPSNSAFVSGDDPQAGARAALPLERALNQRYTSEARLSGDDPQAGARSASLTEGVLNPNNRSGEWFVPNFGPARFRSFVGLLFLPYTGMVLSFSVIGSVLAGSIDWNRVLAIVIIYFLGLGIGAHALDALGSKGNKPWGEAFTKSELWLIAVASLVSAYAIAVYYMVRYVPFLCTVAIAGRLLRLRLQPGVVSGEVPLRPMVCFFVGVPACHGGLHHADK